MNEFQNISDSKLHRGYYTGSDVVELALDFIGKVLVTNFNGEIRKGIIVETEAYRGRDDKACHANDGKRTKRIEIMYAYGGHAYVYLCYGIHHLFNIVTNEAELADAVLIRALHPIAGIEIMESQFSKSGKLITKGPGLLTKAMGINTEHNGIDLHGNEIWVEEGVKLDKEKNITASTRIGVAYAQEHALRPWRFYLTGNRYVSKTENSK